MKLSLLGATLAFALMSTAVCQTPSAPAPTPAPDAPPQQPALSQQQSGPGFTLSVTTRIVVLDVVVTDKHGNAVKRADFKRDDFTIYEDGKPQKIRSFEIPNDHQMPGDGTKAIVNSAADLKKIGDAPVTVLVLDELNSRFEDMSFARNQMVKYLESQPKVLPQPAVLMLASNSTFQQLHDYTQDRDALIDIVHHHMPEYPWRMMNSGKGGPGAVERMAQVLAAMQQIAQSSTGTSGRKNLIWVGNGFPSADLTTLDDQEATTILAAIKRVTNMLLAARITMYSINPAPGTVSTIDVEDPEDLAMAADENGFDPFNDGTAASFNALTSATGGIAFQGRNDLNNVIGEGIARGSFYYTLSYSPTSTSTDAVKFRNIKIVMKDPNFRAVTREGYYPESASDNPVLDKELKPKQQRASLQLDLSGALTSTISYNGLDVTAVKAGKGVYRIKVADRGLTWTGDGGAEHAEATLAAGFYNAKGKLISHVAKEEVSMRGDGTGGVYTLEATPPAGVVRMRIVVRDALSGRMGTVDLTTF
jgi:VWFA-related protein